MSFYRKIKYFLVHSCGMNNAGAQAAIDNGEVEINGVVIRENVSLDEQSEIKVGGVIKRHAKTFFYIRFYKPIGFESTLAQSVKDNLSGFFSAHEGLSIAGRLDKASEGLLLLSNDGKWVQNIIHPQFEKEKEYLVQLDRDPDQEFIRRFSEGVNIRHYVTLPCKCIRIKDQWLQVTLKEGKNRQIRKMCKTLGYTVTALKRIRIGSFHIGNLKAGEYKLTNI